MKNMNKILTIIFIQIIGLATLQAQTTIATSGGNATGTGGSVSYTIGQVFYQTHTSTGGSVAEGVQQPWEISVVTSVEEANGINLTVAAYPNPASDYLKLEINDFNFTDLSFQLFDIQGRVLQISKITDQTTTILMDNLVPAVYFVRVIQGNREVKTFKIVKN
jgi:hypothetical protein